MNKITRNKENKSGLFIGGGVIAGLAASLCCIGPLILTLLGISGAAALSRSEFIRIPAIVGVLILFGRAAFLLFRKPVICAPGSICADPKKLKRMRILFFFGIILSFLAITSPYWIGYLFS